MTVPDRYLAVHNLGLVQRQAGVDREVAELVQAYGRLRVDAGLPVEFAFTDFAHGTLEARVFNRIRTLNPDSDDRFLRFLAAYGAELERRNLPAIFSAAQLASRLGVSRAYMYRILSQPQRYYRELRIPKRSGGERVLMAPYGRLREMQRWIHRQLLARVPIHAAAHAFVKGRSIVSNARPHVQKHVVIRIDLEDFFPSIRAGVVRKAIQRLGYPYTVAAAIASLCTVDGRLPQGAPTSPALSNLVSLGLDKRFTALGHRLGFTYTRYADDLVFSSDDGRLPSLLPFLRDVITSEGYRVNEEKLRVMRPGNAQAVTGIVVNETVGLSRKRMRLLRAALHRLRTKGPGAVQLSSEGHGADPVEVLRGHLAFARMVNPARAKALIDRSTRRT